MMMRRPVVWPSPSTPRSSVLRGKLTRTRNQSLTVPNIPKLFFSRFWHIFRIFLDLFMIFLVFFPKTSGKQCARIYNLHCCLQPQALYTPRFDSQTGSSMGVSRHVPCTLAMSTCRQQHKTCWRLLKIIEICRKRFENDLLWPISSAGLGQEGLLQQKRKRSTRFFPFYSDI
jgi:hypothetical protein